MGDAEETLLTSDEAYRATFHFIHQYYKREPIDPFLLMLVSMTPWTLAATLARPTTRQLGTTG